MALDSMNPNQAKGLNPKQQVELAVRMTVKMLDEGGGIKVIGDALKQSRDPAQVVGQFLAQIVGQLAEQLQKQFNVDPAIFLTKGGWLDIILDYIEAELGLPSEFSDQVYGNVLETVKAAAQGGENPEQAPQQGAAPQGNVPSNAGGPAQQGLPPGAPAPAQPGRMGLGG